MQEVLLLNMVGKTPTARESRGDRTTSLQIVFPTARLCKDCCTVRWEKRSRVQASYRLEAGTEEKQDAHCPTYL